MNIEVRTFTAHTPTETLVCGLTGAEFALLRELLKLDEGRRAKPYDDATGKPLKRGVNFEGHVTIGIGCELSIDGLRGHEIEYLFCSRLEEAIRTAERFAMGVWPELSFCRRAVLINMAFALGPKLDRWKRTQGCLFSRNWPRMAAEIKDSRWYRTTGKRRLDRLAKMVASDSWPMVVIRSLDRQQGKPISRGLRKPKRKRS